MSNKLESENSRKENIVEKVINFFDNASFEKIALIIILISSITGFLVSYFTRDYYITFNNVDNEQIAAIVKQYKNFHKKSTEEYNRILTNYQRNGKLIAPDSFYSTHKTTLEYNCKTNHDYCSNNNLIKNLNKNLTEYNNKLANKIEKVNNAISDNIKVDYNSLKTSDNINNNWLQSIVKQHVEDCKNRLKTISDIGKFILVFILVAGFLCTILL